MSLAAPWSRRAALVAEQLPAGETARVGRASIATTTVAETDTIELMVVEHDVTRVRALAAAGVRTFLVDWECLGKTARQQGFDTEIRPATIADLAAVSAIPGVVAWCRINALGTHSAAEIDAAVEAGAHGVFLPMVTRAADVELFLRLLNGRAAAAILVETVEALAVVSDLASYPLDRAYFGLNDFAISRGGGSIFRAVSDGSVARARAAFDGAWFGFGGLTAADAGSPVPCRSLMEEMARLGCQFSFLRRSFRRDLATRDAGATIAGIREAWLACMARDAASVERDHAALCAIVDGLA